MASFFIFVFNLDMAFKIDTVKTLSNDRSVLQTYNTLSGKEKLSDNFYLVPNEKKDEFVKAMKDKESRQKNGFLPECF